MLLWTEKLFLIKNLSFYLIFLTMSSTIPDTSRYAIGNIWNFEISLVSRKAPWVLLSERVWDPACKCLVHRLEADIWKLGFFSPRLDPWLLCRGGRSGARARSCRWGFPGVEEWTPLLHSCLQLSGGHHPMVNGETTGLLALCIWYIVELVVY